jgi:arginine-tRNA-protein transferase
MADMDVFEFAAMIEETPICTRVMEYEQHHDLKAVCLTDMFNDGLSMVYSFFDPDLSDRSMGTYLILDHIKMAQELGLPYVYLGYWVPGSPKMGYKARFSGLEIYRDKAWTPLSECENISSNLHPLNTAPIAEQVANLSLPGSNPLGE